MAFGVAVVAAGGVGKVVAWRRVALGLAVVLSIAVVGIVVVWWIAWGGAYVAVAAAVVVENAVA